MGGGGRLPEGARSRDLDLCSRTSGAGLCSSSPGLGRGPQPPSAPCSLMSFCIDSCSEVSLPRSLEFVPCLWPKPQSPSGCRLPEITGVQKMGGRERGSHLPFPVTTGTAGKNLQLLIWSPPGFLAACLIPAVSATLASPSPSPRP